MEAIKYMKNNKAEGVEGVPAEFLKSLGKQKQLATEELINLKKIFMNRVGLWISQR